MLPLLEIRALENLEKNGTKYSSACAEHNCMCSIKSGKVVL
jgi:hypothetical protein